MADGAGFKVEGLKELEKMLKQFPPATANSGLTQASAAAGGVLRKRARANVSKSKGINAQSVQSRKVPHKPGLLRKSIRVIRLKRNKRRSTVGVRVGVVPKNNKRFTLQEAFYAHMVHNGVYGKPGNPFLGKAQYQASSELFSAFKNKLQSFIDKKLAKFK